MEIFEETIAIIPGKPKPEPEDFYDDEFYCRIKRVKGSGKRKKKDLIYFTITYVPWDELNQSELMQLALYGRNLREDNELWMVLHRGLSRTTLINLIRGVIDPSELPENPVHKGRKELQMLIHEYWRNIWSQIGCDTFCWNCPDAKVLECVLENYDNLPGGRS